MAMLISRATGNFTSSSTWGVADNATGSQLTNPSAATTTTTSYVYSSTFTGTNAKVADGVVLFLRRANTTGTFSVALSDDNGVTATRSVTVNASDLPQYESWVFFKFGTTLTLDGGTDYRVGVLGSSAGNVSVGRDGTAGNWARMVSTTDTAAPAAGDTMLVVGELTGAGTSNSFTVTMDNTATTDFGNGTATATAPTQTNAQNFNGIQIGKNGTLTWGTSAATAYYLKLSGNLIVWADGTYNMGTTGTPCPRDSSMYLQFDCVANGDFGFLGMDGCTINLQGLSRTSGKNVFYCKLNTDEAVASTSLGVDTDTGWLDNDAIAVASTTRTISQSENGLLNGAAGAATLTVDGFGGAGGGLAFAHSGTSPFQAEVILLTRNVRISGASSTVASYLVVNSSATTCDWDWTEFFWLGATAAGSAKVGVTIAFNTTFSGTFDMQYCCIRNSTFTPFNVQFAFSSTATMTFSNNVVYNCLNNVTFSGKSAATGTLTVTNNIIMLITGVGQSAMICGYGTFDNNTVISATVGFQIGSQMVSFANNTAHTHSQYAISYNLNSFAPVVIDNFYGWRTSNGGINISISFVNITMNNSTFTGCAGAGITQGNGIHGVYFIANNVNFSTEASFAMPYGLQFFNASSNGNNGQYYELNDCTINSTTGDIYCGQGVNNTIFLNNTLLSGATEVLGQSNLTTNGSVKSSKNDQTEGAFKSWFKYGTIERDTTIFNTAAPSERLTPNNASFKLQSGTRVAAVDDLGTITINAYVRKSVAGDGAAYNGNQPRLIVKKNLACGITSDTVLDTMTAAAGSWEQLTGTTAAVNADGALEFVVDCDGTTGWINVDDWSVS